MSGGKFGHGFSAAGITSMAGGKIGQAFKGVGAKVVASAVAGGTVSKLTGGKFGNGAVTAAFMSAYNEANHQEFSSPDAPLAKWFRSLNDGAARIRGNIEGWFYDTFGGSSVGLSGNAGGHAVLVGKSVSISKLWDVNGQSCTVYTVCTKYGPGILVSAGVDIETNFSSMPMQEGATSSTIGVFAEGGLGEVIGGSLNVDQSGQSTQSIIPLPDVGKLKLGLGAGAAAGIQHCVSEVLACSG